MRRFWKIILTTIVILLSVTTGITQAQAEPVVRVVYFYAEDCPHCHVVEAEVLAPLQAQYGDRLEILQLEISSNTNYTLLVQMFEFFAIPFEHRDLPIVVIGGEVMIGEEQIRLELSCLLDACLTAGGTSWPAIPGLEEVMRSDTPNPTTAAPGIGIGPGLYPALDPSVGVTICNTATVSLCRPAAPIWAAYFYQTGCQACSLVERDIEYLQEQHPELVVERYNIYDDLDLAQWLARRADREEELHTPALFVGEQALFGEQEINPNSLAALVEEYSVDGAPRVWTDFDPEEAAGGSFQLPGLLTVIGAGLIDGLNPCAFATIVFLIAYLAASERKGGQVLAVGGAFTLGVLAAYLVVGLGLYRALDLLGDLLTTLGRWVYGLTAVLCIVLAVLSFLDYLKARRGNIEDMSLSLPGALRKRVRSVIRSGQKARAYIVAALVTGVLVSLLELACTGQIYLPTIIFVASQPALRVQGTAYLLLYNLFFILPLVVVFVLTYLGTTSQQLGLFLQRRAATVKLATTMVFVALALWLGISLIG